MPRGGILQDRYKAPSPLWSKGEGEGSVKKAHVVAEMQVTKQNKLP